MNDFEERVKQALNARVDAELGDRRAATPFEPRRRRGAAPARHRSPWLLPLIAAACVAAVVGGTAGVSRMVADRHAPATQAPTVSRSVPATTAVPSPTPSSAATRASAPRTRAATTTGSSSRTGVDRPAVHLVELGAASIYVPSGWVVRDLTDYSAPPSSPIFPGWCLTPASVPVKPLGCPVILFKVDPRGNPLDVDIEGGIASNPHYCFETQKRREEQYGDRAFGGRAAEWRRWDYECTTGRHFAIEQYVVPTVPGYILFSEHASESVHAAMADVAERSMLPEQSAPLRLMDRGYVRSMHRTAGVVHIAVDRVVWELGPGPTIMNNNPATYDYVVPVKVFDASRRPITVGTLVHLSTNGYRVTGINRM